jgi:uncharacterized protein (TIGR03437 family)
VHGNCKDLSLFVFLLCASAAHARILVFNVSGTMADGAVLSGTISVDDVADVISAASFTVGPPESLTFSVIEYDGFPSGSGYLQTIPAGARIGSLPDFNLLFSADTLIGYQGGPLSTLSSVVLPGGITVYLRSGNATSTVPLITPTSIADAVSGQPYSVRFSATGGSGVGYSWSLSSGSLPPGFNLSPDGLLSSTGTPADTPASYVFAIQVADSIGNFSIQPLTMSIRATGSVIVTIAGTGTPGPLTCSASCGPAMDFSLQLPSALGFDSAGNLYIAQNNNLSPYPAALFKLAPNAVLTQVLSGPSGLPGSPTVAGFTSISGLQVAGSASIYVSDWIGEAVYLVSLPSPTVALRIAGSGLFNPFDTNFSGDGGPAVAAQFDYPWGVAVDGAGNLYIADSRNNRIRQVDGKGTITTIAGTGSPCIAGCGGFSGDGGPANQAQLNTPMGMTITPGGELYVADSGNGRVRKISPAGPNGIISTVAENFQSPIGVAVDQGGNIYVAESFRIQEVSPAGIVTTIAGNGLPGYAGDGGPPGNALLNGVGGIALDANNSLYISDGGNNRVRMIVDALAGVENAASYATGSVAPGEIVVLYGTALGPSSLAGWQVDSTSGRFATTVVGTTVLFNGVLAPIVYTSANQVAVIVPYEVDGAATAQILVNYRGYNVAAGTVTVAASAPSIFTMSSGTGQAAAINQDGSVNDAANPAAEGSTIVLYLTGEGQTSPFGVDGQIASSAPFPMPHLPVKVTIGGQTAAYSYAGAAPDDVAGVMQINAIIPSGIVGSAVPISVQIGTASTQNGVTIAVQ